jgi:chemotaxis protein methyltransferase CheR
MLLEEMLPRRPYSVIATDIDETILARARAGAGYGDPDLRNVDTARRARFFTREAGGTYAVKEGLKRNVRFRRHDLLGPVPEADFDLIVCRNVVIYFTEETKRTLYQRFLDALRPNGVLFVGGTEVVMGARELGFTPLLTSFYRKEGVRCQVSGVRCQASGQSVA